MPNLPVNSDGLLAYTPTSLAELPAFFRKLDDKRLRRVWVSAIVQCFGEFGEDENARHLDVCVPQLAKALVAVRDHDGETRNPEHRKPTADRVAKFRQAIAVMSEATAVPGEVVVLRSLFPNWYDIDVVSRWVRASPEASETWRIGRNAKRQLTIERRR